MNSFLMILAVVVIIAIALIFIPTGWVGVAAIAVIVAYAIYKISGSSQ